MDCIIKNYGLDMEEVYEVITKFLNTPLNEIAAEPIESGLINKTFLITDSSSNKKFVLQRINIEIFKSPEALISNYNIIFDELIKSKCTLKVAKLYTALEAGFLFYDIENYPWRMFLYIKKSKTFNKTRKPQIAFEAAKSFSKFYKYISFNKKIQLETVLPNFIDFKKRLIDFEIALKNSNQKFISDSKTVLDFVLKNINLPEYWIELQEKNLLPIRIIHADPKISNILFDKKNKGLAIIDLDTAMQGTILYDFGDMIRSYSNLLKEDDPRKGNFDEVLYNAAKVGFLYHIDKKLLNIEVDNLDYAAQAVIYVQCVRFLTDFLNGSIYYSTTYENQNLNRAINQMNLLVGLMDYHDSLN
ncbi:MAG: hypothetical protein RLZZ312_931 [Bacteroidota bacterium]|jgi:thiamine kinase-like enzyme